MAALTHIFFFKILSVNDLGLKSLRNFFIPISLQQAFCRRPPTFIKIKPIMRIVTLLAYYIEDIL